MKELAKKAWYYLIESLYHLIMSILKAVGKARVIAWHWIDVPPKNSPCDGKCTDKFNTCDPIEWRDDHGRAIPVFRVARLLLPINPFNRQQGIPLTAFITSFKCLPKDTRLVDVRYGMHYGQTVEYLVQSAEFPEHLEGEQYPAIQLIKASRILTDAEILAQGAVGRIEEYFVGWKIDPFGGYRSC